MENLCWIQNQVLAFIIVAWIWANYMPIFVVKVKLHRSEKFQILEILDISRFQLLFEINVESQIKSIP